MNQIFVPIERVHLETVFERGGRTEYALLQPAGGITPLRMRFTDLRKQLEGRFSPELDGQTVLDRISRMKDEQLLVVIHLDREDPQRIELRIRRRFPYEQKSAASVRAEQRKSPRVKLEQRTDVRVELGKASIEGTVYNISEHGLGIALHTSQLDPTTQVPLDEKVEVTAGGQTIQARLRSQYPADGGCVLGLELQQRLRLPGLPDIEA